MQREAIRDTMRSRCSDYLRKMLREEFGNQVPWEVLDGMLTFHATRGTSPFLQNKVYQQNRLNFPVFLHRRAIRNIRQITPTKFLITLRLLSIAQGRDVHFIVATSKKHGELLTNLLKMGKLPRNPIIKRTARRKVDILILTIESKEEENQTDPDLIVGIDMNVDSIDFAFIDREGTVLILEKLSTGFRQFFMDWYKHWNRLKRVNGHHTSRQMKRLLRAQKTKKRQVLDQAIHLIQKQVNGQCIQIRIERLDHIRMRMVPEFPHWAKRSFIYGGELAKKLQNVWPVDEINPVNTSCTCSHCAHVHSDRENQHQFSCEKCGLMMDSHLNAAIVIAAGGVKALQQLKGKHGVTHNTPPPASPPSGRRRGFEKECVEICEI